MSIQSRTWAFTQYGEKQPFLPEELPEGCNYIVWQWEICPSTGRKHQQGYLECAKKTTQRSKFLDGILGNSHRELPKKGPLAAARYCKMEFYPEDHEKYPGKPKRIPGTVPFEYGKPIKQSGMSKDEKEKAAADYKRNYDLYPAPSAVHPRFVCWCFGKPRTGKTTHVRKLITTVQKANWTPDEKSDVYEAPGRSKCSAGRWLGPYAHQPIMVCEEFDHDEYGLNFLKSMTDTDFSHNLPQSMGGAKNVIFDACAVYLISNHTRAQVEEILEENPAFAARITQCVDFKRKPFVDKSAIKWSTIE